MSAPEEHEVDAHSGTKTTGHVWDGIRELDTPLPRWWLIIFYATIAISLVYWVLMPAWPLLNSYTTGVLGYSDRRQVAAEVQALEGARAPNFARLMDASAEAALADPELADFAFAAGQVIFKDNCATCHGAGGAGRTGYPSLADDAWIWGGTLGEIERTITYGVRSGHEQARFSQMPAFGKDDLLTKAEIGDVTEFVLSLGPAAARVSPNPQAAARGASVFAAQCASCHGADGAGDVTFGAPSLKDDIWLYGGRREDVRAQIELGRAGVMPNWDRRFDAASLRAVALYVYALGGGQPSAAAPAQVTPAGLAPAPEIAP